MQKVDEKVAKAEVDKWLEYLRIKDSKRAENADAIQSVVNAMMDGDLTLDTEKFELTYKLTFPITSGDKPIEELVFQPRLSVLKLQEKLVGVKPTDADGRVMAYVCALTGKPKQVIKMMEVRDYSLPQILAIFFI